MYRFSKYFKLTQLGIVADDSMQQLQLIIHAFLLVIYGNASVMSILTVWSSLLQDRNIGTIHCDFSANCQLF